MTVPRMVGGTMISVEHHGGLLTVPRKSPPATVSPILAVAIKVPARLSWSTAGNVDAAGDVQAPPFSTILASRGRWMPS